MSPQPHEVPQMPHDLEPAIDDEWLGSPDAIATVQAVTGYSVDDLYYFGGFDPHFVRHFLKIIIYYARDELPCVLNNQGYWSRRRSSLRLPGSFRRSQ
jgi:hypothetical protein